MHVHRAVIAGVLIAPHHVEQVLPGVHPARVAQQQLHQVELLGGEIHALAVLPGGPGVHVQGDVAHGQPAAALLLGRHARPAQQGPHPGLQLQNVEGLGDVVVRPALEADDLVGVLAAGGEHDDGHVGELPDAHTGLEPVDLGHHQIQDNEIEGAVPGQLHRLLPVIARLHLVALALQVELDALDQHLLVVYHQYFHRFSSPVVT